MHPMYLYRPHQAPLARPWTKLRRRGKPLTIWFPNGAEWYALSDKGHWFYVSNPYFDKKAN